MAKRFVQSSSPQSWDMPFPDDVERRAANRARVAAGKSKKTPKASRNPQIADSNGDRWRSRDRAAKAAAERRQVGMYE